MVLIGRHKEKEFLWFLEISVEKVIDFGTSEKAILCIASCIIIE